MLHEALTEILKRLKHIEAMLEKLLPNKHSVPSSELQPTETLNTLKQRIMANINEHWTKHKLPIPYHLLARKYNRDCAKLSSFNQITIELQTEKHLHLFKNLTGAATFCMPQNAKNELNPVLYEKLCELNLSEKQIKAFHDKQAEMAKLQLQINDRMENADIEFEQLETNVPEDMKPKEISQAELDEMLEKKPASDE